MPPFDMKKFESRVLPSCIMDKIPPEITARYGRFTVEIPDVSLGTPGGTDISLTDRFAAEAAAPRQAELFLRSVRSIHSALTDAVSPAIVAKELAGKVAHFQLGSMPASVAAYLGVGGALHSAKNSDGPNLPRLLLQRDYDTVATAFFPESSAPRQNDLRTTEEQVERLEGLLAAAKNALEAAFAGQYAAMQEMLANATGNPLAEHVNRFVAGVEVAYRVLVEKIGVTEEKKGAVVNPEIVEPLQEITSEMLETDPKLRAQLEMNIEMLFLSTRAEKCLQYANIRTVGELIVKKEQELLMIPNMWKTTLNGIKEILARMRLSLGTKIDLQTLSSVAPVAIEEITQTRIARDPDLRKNLLRSVDNIGLTVRTVKALHDAGIHYVWKLHRITEQILLGRKKFGRASVREIKKALADMGLLFGNKVYSKELAEVSRVKIVDSAWYMVYLRESAELLHSPWINAESKQMLSERVNRILSCLTPREQRVLRLRCGLEDGRIHTLAEVGKVFNVTRERARQIVSTALRKLVAFAQVQQ